jgi:hypothetical protein
MVAILALLKKCQKQGVKENLRTYLHNEVLLKVYTLHTVLFRLIHEEYSAHWAYVH